MLDNYDTMGLNKLHVNLRMLYFDIIYLACWRQNYATIVQRCKQLNEI